MPPSRRKVRESTRVRVYIVAFGRCRYCNGSIAWRDLHADHVVPVKRGGDNWGNLVASCSSCNLKKATKLWEPIPLKWWQKVLDLLIVITYDTGYITDGIKEKLGL